MKNPNKLAVYALVTSALTFGAGSALAQQSASDNTKSELPTTEQRKQDNLKSDVDNGRDKNQMDRNKTQHDGDKKSD